MSKFNFMFYSKPHQAFSDRLNNLDVLKNPAKYLGPNYQDVLNFWIYLDTLSDEEREEMNDCYLALDNIVRVSAFVAARDAAEGVVGEEFRRAAWRPAWNAAYDVTGRVVFGTATMELITHHKLLEQDKTPTSLPLCVKP
jgi:hypothetical protein